MSNERLGAPSCRVNKNLQQEHNCLLAEFSKLLTEKNFLISTLKETNLQPKENVFHLENNNWPKNYIPQVSNSNQSNSIEGLKDDTEKMLSPSSINGLQQENSDLMQENSNLSVAAHKSLQLVENGKRENNQLLKKLEKLLIHLEKTKSEKRRYRSSLEDSKKHSDQLQRKLTIAANSYKELLIKHKEIKTSASNSIILQKQKFNRQKQADEKNMIQLQLHLGVLESQLEGDKKLTNEIMLSFTSQQNKTTELSKRVIELETQVHEMQRIINQKTIENKDLMDSLITFRKQSHTQYSTSTGKDYSSSFSPNQSNQNNSNLECSVDGPSAFECSRQTPEGRQVGLFEK